MFLMSSQGHLETENSLPQSGKTRGGRQNPPKLCSGGWSGQLYLPFCDLILLDLVVLMVKNPPANAGDIRDAGLIPGSGCPWRRAWQSTPVFLPGESHGQRSLVGYRL